MNQDKLNRIFENYIARFNELNNPEHHEKYKWEIAYYFKRDLDDVLASDAAEMASKMKALVEKASNLLQNKYELPGAALYLYMDKDRAPEETRTLLLELLADDGGDLALRQRKIESFIAGCNKLKEQYFPNSYKYEMSQRAAMVILGLYDPEANYLYKSNPANEFADCVEFYEDWGSGSDFRLATYYRMCDQLVDKMRENPALMERHQSRYQNPELPMHPDRNLHILAFDIIYCCRAYGLYYNIPYEHISSRQRKEYLDNQAKAQVLAEALDQAQAQCDLYAEAAAYYAAAFAVGTPVNSKAFGSGTVTKYVPYQTGDFISVRFSDGIGEKSFVAAKAAVDGLLTSDDPELQERNQRYAEVVRIGKRSLEDRLKAAKKELQPYQPYLID